MVEHYLGVLPRDRNEGLVTLLQGDCADPGTHGRVPLTYGAMKAHGGVAKLQRAQK